MISAQPAIAASSNPASRLSLANADTVRAGIQRYRDAGATSPCLGPISKTDFAATLEAGAPAA